MKKLILMCMALVYILPQYAQSKAAADSSYAAEEYEKAISIYTNLLKEGEHADVYYNLGNAYYKAGRMALAILNYERAILLDPGNSDIRFNLELARSKTVDKIIPESEMFFVTWYKNIVNMISMDQWAYAAVLAFIVMCVCVLLYFLGNKILLKKLGFFGALAMLLFVLMANVFAWTQYKNQNERNGAVIMAGSVVVKSTPNESGTDLFVLHEGVRVEVIDNSMKEWKEVRLSDGKRGWIPTKVMEVI